jgi:hypothetical protein
MKTRQQKIDSYVDICLCIFITLGIVALVLCMISLCISLFK